MPAYLKRMSWDQLCIC